MNDLNINDSGFLSKAAALLNSKTFSDVEIQVVNDGTNPRSYSAHKLFLAMNSEEFAKMFYGVSEPPRVVKIFDFKPKIVYMMLEFIYTDQTDLSNIEESKNLYRLAKKYDVKDLERYCLTYLVKENITLNNIFDKYEFSLTENIPEALRACRDIASTHTMDVIKSPRFSEASLPVVEDILQLDTLSVMSELDLIEAAIEWGKQECYRRGAFTENLRICVYPLFKHLRFLTLTASEFFDMVEKYDKLLNSHESSLLTRAIIQPDIGLRLPSGFSSNSNPREQPKSRSKENELLIPTSNTLKHLNNNEKKPAWSFDLDLNDHLRDNYGLNKATKQDSNSKSIKIDEYDAIFSQFSRSIPMKQDSNDVKYNEKEDTFSQFRQNPNKQESTLNSAKLNEFEAFSQLGKKDSNSSSVKFTNNASAFSKLNPPSAPIKRINVQSIPVNLNRPTPLNFNQRTFNFPLFDFDKSLGMNSVFPNDIKCSAKIYVNKGAIEIYGVELKIKQKTSDEVIEAHLRLNGSSISTRDLTCEEKLKNSVLSLTFGEPVKLYKNNDLNVEVVVEELALNRCSGCRNDRCELNSGLNLSAEIWMKSNQSNNDSQGFFYLFHRLLYKPLP